MRLYDIAQEYKNVLLLLDDEDIDPQAVQDTLESIEGDFEEKADNTACIIKGNRVRTADLLFQLHFAAPPCSPCSISFEDTVCVLC